MIQVAAATIKKIRALKAVNNHGAAYALVAKTLGCNDLAEQFGHINRQQLRLGHLPWALYEKRHALYQSLMEQAQALLRPEDYQRVYQSL